MVTQMNHVMSAEGLVSIPKRVSEALKRPEDAITNLWEKLVSIPKRVSEALKPTHQLHIALRISFQSLKGFQRL